MATCPPAQLWHDIGRTWMLALLDSLSRNTSGFNDLQDELGISNKVLSERLELLEQNGCIVREYYDQDGTQRVRITLTKKGEDLFGVVKKYREFITKHYDLPCGSVPCSSCEHFE